MNNYSFEAHNKIVEITKDIISVAQENLDSSVFYEMGANVGQGLANGLSSQISAVRSAAEALSAAAASATIKYNGIHSPSKLYRGFGKFIGTGFGMGMKDSAPEVVSSAMSLSKAIMNTLEQVKAITEDEINLNPVITPTLDLTNLRENAGVINSMFPGRSLALASSIGGSIDATRGRYASNTSNSYTYGGATIYVTARDGESADHIADRVINKLDRQMNRRKAVNGV